MDTCDFHTHIYPDAVAARTVSAVHERAGIDAYTKGALEGLKSSMAAAGSDSPWTDQGEELRFLLQLPFLTESDKEKICCSNAAHLLGLENA